MNNEFGRRDFMRLAGAGVLAVSPALAWTAKSSAPAGKPMLKKSLKFSMIDEPNLSILEKFRMLKELGFDGAELDSPNDLDRAEVIEARDKSGLVIPGVIDSVHWEKTLSDPDPEVRGEGLEGLRTALSDARSYGSTTVLLVPAVVNKQVSYEDAYKRSQAEIRKALPWAREMGVKIAIENVWNHFLMSPLETARYIDEFEDPWIGAYFDIGNVVNFGWPEQWIRTLGHRILKADIKEFSREKRDKEGLWAGFNVELAEGDCDWPAVRQAFKDIGYRGWGSAEVPGGGRARLQEISERMDRILTD